MSTLTTFDAGAARTPVAPFGARIGADLFSRFTGWLSRSAAPRVLTRAEEAAEVRELAYRVQASDPGFAADLYGAAARHEALDD